MTTLAGSWLIDDRRCSQAVTPQLASYIEVDTTSVSEDAALAKTRRIISA